MPASETVTLPDAVEDTLRERQYSAKSAARAVRLQCGAAKKRAVAPGVAFYDPTGAGFQRREADAMDDDAPALLELSAMPSWEQAASCWCCPSWKPRSPAWLTPSTISTQS